MRWVTGTAIVGAVVAASVAAVVASGPGVVGQDKARDKEKAPAKVERQVRVSPQIEIFGVGGPEIGVTLKDLDDEAAKAHKVTGTEGVLVDSVREGSPAEKAGIKAGDVIREFDGEKVRSYRHLRRLVTESTAGRAIKVVVVRDGKDVSLTVTPRESSPDIRIFGDDAKSSESLQKELERGLERVPRGFDFRYFGPGDRSPNLILPSPRWHQPVPREGTPFSFFFEPGTGRLGVAVQELTPQLGDYFGVKDGVLVATVNPDTPAAKAGVKAGDIITTINGKAVDSADTLISQVRKADEGDELTLGILRDHKPLTIKVKLTRSGRGVGTPT